MGKKNDKVKIEKYSMWNILSMVYFVTGMVLIVLSFVPSLNKVFVENLGSPAMFLFGAVMVISRWGYEYGIKEGKSDD